jgi:hypothetical protein
MNRENRDALIQYFGVACANIESVLESLNTYEQQIVDGVPTTEESITPYKTAVEDAKGNTMTALKLSQHMRLHKQSDMHLPLSSLNNNILKMETAFDESCVEEGDQQRDWVKKAINYAVSAQKACNNLYKKLVNMPVVPNNNGNNKGGSRKRTEKKRHAKRTAKCHAKRTEKKRTHRK